MTVEREQDRLLVCKFGGTSCADAGQIRRVAAIVRSESRRRYIVVSAPGKRTAADKKITDLLYACHHAVSQGRDVQVAFGTIRERYTEIAQQLEVRGAEGWLDEVEAEIKNGASQDWVASRGEYLSARLVAAFLGAKFVDAADGICFDEGGRLDPASYANLREILRDEELCVIPGFYGRDYRGNIKTFSRGGSDVTGSVVARAVSADAYENWTDVDGLLMTDPRIVSNPLPIREVTYQELRELAYMGASVLHDEATFPVSEAGIPIHICNTNAPDMPGTWIRATRPNDNRAVIGIAGRRGFTAIQIEKSLMNTERGFGRRVLQVLEDHGISYEHTPTSIDTMSVIVEDGELAHKRESVLADMERVLKPDRIDVFHGLSLIATVGQGMSHRIGVAGKLFSALAQAGVNLRMIDQGASEINIIIGVTDADFETAIRAIYETFAEP